MKKRGERYKQTSDEIVKISDNMCQGLNSTTQEMHRVSDICQNAEQIIVDIDKEFAAATKLDGFDVSFLFTATAMQCIRQYFLTPFTERVDDKTAAKNVKGDIKEKSNRLHRWYNPSLNEILTNPVPFDAINQSDRLKKRVLEETGRKILAGDKNHRFVTLGHDPIIGLVVGTANIATSTLTTWEMSSYHVKTGPKGDRIENIAQTDKVFSYTWNKLLHEGLPGKEKVGASLVKEVIHLKSDVRSTLSLPIPIVSRFDPKLARKLAGYGIDTGSTLDVLKQATEAQAINLLIAMLHGICFYFRTGQGEELLHIKSYASIVTHKTSESELLDLHKVKTRKILLYSNLIASSSNVIAVAVAQYMGKRDAMRYLDIGGLAVTLYRLISDVHFMRRVKREFLENKWYDTIMGSEESTHMGGQLHGQKSFEAGMAAGVKPVGEKLDQLGQKIENVRSKQEEVKEKLSMLSDDLEIKDKLRQLGLENYHDLTELDDSEKVILMSLLYWLAEHKTPSDNQRKYLSCLGRYIGVLGIKENISPVDVLQNISDTDVHKVFLRTILEYVYLDTQTWTFDESEQDLIGTFEVGPRTLENIKRGIEGEFHILGDDGLAQKYDIREVLKESEQVQSEPTKETEVEEAVNSDMGIADGEEPVRPFHQLISTIQRYTMTEKLGKPLLITMAEIDKNRLIAKVLPTIPLVSKTVVEITKLKSGHLVFTTSAMYWSTNKDVKKISYSELNPGCLGIRPTEAGTAFVYTFKGNDPLEIMDSKLSADFLERLLLEINQVGEYAGTDVLTNFQNLPQEIQLSYVRFVANVVRESGHSLHEVYRLAVQYGLNEHWDYISTEFELSFEDEFRTYSEKIPYPNEEALAISMLKDICTVYQYTKDSDILVTPEKKYFSLIFNDTTAKRDQIIRYAQLEKQTMERRVDPEEVQKITDDFSNTVFGGIGGCIGMMGVMFPMLFVPGMAALIAAAAVSGIVFSGKNKKLFSEIEMRQKVQNEVMRSYQGAEKAANDQGFPEFFDLLQQEEIRIASRIHIQRTGYTEKERAVLDQIRSKIIECFTRWQKSFVENGRNDLAKFLRLAEDLTMEEQEKLMSCLAISSCDENYIDIIAFEDRAFLDTTFENFVGMLFLSDCIYYRSKKSVYTQKMSYFNMLKVEKKLTSVILYGRNGDMIKLEKNDAAGLYLLQDIISIVNQNI